MEEAPEQAPHLPRSTKRKKKRKKLDVVIDFVSTQEGFSSPYVGYFPSGFDPQACQAGPKQGGEDAGETALNAVAYQNTEHYKTRQRQLIVTPPQGNVDFIGTNYLGEGASWQPGNYALGVLDKHSNTLKLYPLGGAKVLRLDPRVRGVDYGESLSTATTVGVPEMTKEMISQQRNLLTATFGTHKSRVKLNRYERAKVKEDALGDKEEIGRIFEKAVDNLLVLTTEEAVLQANNAISRNIPPYNLMATTPDQAYVFDKIITPEEQESLDDLELLKDAASKSEQVEELQKKQKYPEFILKRIFMLKVEGPARNKFAVILSYMRHLLAFYNLPRHIIRSLADPMGYGSDKGRSAIDLSRHLNMPDAVAMKILKLFTTINPGESRVHPAEKRDLLICYILVLGLMIDGFRSDPYDLSMELRMTISKLKQYYLELGCKFKTVKRRDSADPQSAQKLHEVVLTMPLEFPKLKGKARRK